MVDRVLSELADARDGITLVIDDLHELTSPHALAQLTRLLTSLPPTCTRCWRPVAISGWGCIGSAWPAGELAEIRAAELRFTERETASSWMPRGSRCPTLERRCCTGGPRGGPRACGWR